MTQPPSAAQEGIAPIGAQASGQPAAPAVSYAELARMAKHETEDPADPQLALDRALTDRLVESAQARMLGEIGELGREELINPADPEVGWGLVFYEDIPQAVRDALEPLRQHRQGRLLPDWGALHTYRGWLRDQGINITNRDTRDLPYYILLVGRPDQILVEYQYELDRIRAVGRLDLGDDPAVYRAYVETVLACEKAPPVARRVLFAAARTPGDDSTYLSADHLVPALAALPDEDKDLQPLGYQAQHLDAARRAQLKAALCADAGGHAPALAFLATHGVSFDAGHAQQVAEQGGWICSDWQGGPVPRQAYLAAADVGPDFYAPGSIIFSLACFGAGSSRKSEYARYYNLLDPQEKLDEQVASRSFVAALPQRLLTYRHGGQPAGALAYIGHVDLSWTSAFWDAEKKQADVALFESLVRRLLLGDTVGMAMEKFAQVVNDFNGALTSFMGHSGKLDISDEKAVGEVWIGRNNAQGFIVLGDPAVRVDPAKLGA